MKKLLFSTLFMIFAVAYLTGCKQDPSSSANNLVPMKTSPPPADAHPAWTFNAANITLSGKSYNGIAVSDSDGTDVTNIYTCIDIDSKVTTQTPTWSTTGASVSFVEKPLLLTYGASAIKAVDISVSNGAVTTSNKRTIYSRSLSDSMIIREQAWCPASGVNKIAYFVTTPAGDDIYTISTSGGTPTKIYSVAKATGSIRPWITWSNDGTKLAFAVDTGTSSNYSDAIKIIDLSGNVQATLIPGAYVAIFGGTWSHSGTDKIAFYGTTSTSGNSNSYNVYTIGTSSGSTETLVVSAAQHPFWSPNNFELVYSSVGSTNAGTNKVVISSGANTFIGQYVKFGDWKTP